MTRYIWIRSYFKDIPLAGLIRMTSRSKSENSFFGGYLNKHLNLIGFTYSFETTMESQKHTQRVSWRSLKLKMNITIRLGKITKVVINNE
uniref:Uncharacterized protein n=1 Tax=Lactuca sativa TaxID=4236 RepID=A0A9R1VUB1_LACSA|nr:hypothetical protein LSAT_V11C400164630 [Lactuca sativa]